MFRAAITVVLAVSATVAASNAATAAAPSRSDLRAVRLDPDSAAPGSTSTVHGLVDNLGPDRTASPFTVLIDLPPGFAFEGPQYPTDCTTSADARLVSCTFPAGLPSLRTATVLAPFRVGSDVPPGTVAEGHVSVFGLDDGNPANNSTPFTITVASP